MQKKDMIVDSHVHVGQFFSHYFSPDQLIDLMAAVKVDRYAVSSTTVCEENYEKVLSEIRYLQIHDSGKLFPVFWITPQCLDSAVELFLESGIQWKMIKIHPNLHPHFWDHTPSALNSVIELARELRVPLLIHTGADSFMSAGIWRSTILDNPDVSFILAHGQLKEEALEVLSNCSNAYVDSAFMTLDDMLEYINSGFSNRLLWGTDMCIPLYYNRHVNLVQYYNNKLSTFKEMVDNHTFEMVTSTNAIKLSEFFNFVYL